MKSRNLRRITKSKRLRAVLGYYPEASSFSDTPHLTTFDNKSGRAGWEVDNTLGCT